MGYAATSTIAIFVASVFQDLAAWLLAIYLLLSIGGMCGNTFATTTRLTSSRFPDCCIGDVSVYGAPTGFGRYEIGELRKIEAKNSIVAFAVRINNSWRRLCELSQSDARKIGTGNAERQPAGFHQERTAFEYTNLAQVAENGLESRRGLTYKLL